MVHITKLVFENFKSFAGKVEIPFDKGFNAIVGPNGSGKSNIIDGIVFVLGSGSRNIRAGRLEHVIFNGGNGRRPADHAIVELHFDNSDHTIEDIDDEIVIFRRVDRSGRSVYKINGKTVNRRQVLELLSKIGVDAESFNIIQQGDVISIVKMRPKERREIVDEIAGIKEYNEKKEKALKELEKAERKLEEAEVLLEEKKRIVEKLEKERNAALEYQQLEARLQALKANLAYSRLKILESNLENVERNLKIKEKEYEALTGLPEQHEKEIEKIEKEIERINEEIISKSVNAQLRKEIEELVGRINKRHAEIESLRREKENLKNMISDLRGMTRAMDSGNLALNTLLQLGMEGVYGTIGSLMRTDEKFSTAIEVAVASHIDDVVVENENVAVQAINYLKREKLGRVRFLPLDRLEVVEHSAKAELASKMPGIIDFAINLVEYDKKFEKAFRYVFRDTLVAEDVDSARRIRGVRVVTLDGDLFEPGGAIIGGYYRKGGKEKITTAQMNKIKEYERRIENIDKEIERLKSEIAELNSLLDEKRKSEREESDEVKKLEERKKELISRLNALKDERRKKVEHNLRLESEINQLRIRKARLEGELENVRLEFEKYKDKEGLEEQDPQKLQQEIRSIESRLRMLGPVNMKAIEDYEVFKKDYDEFRAKVEKLREERRSIIRMIEDLEEKRKRVFLETLTNLSKRFREVYDELVGGYAELKLEDENNIESGLIIEVRPKNQKLVTIDGLSGGEKTMVAIAFLFAVQRYKPYPFYALDEIDAALDPINSEKIGELILKYSETSQFIVISHNDITVKKAKRLYGVVKDKGASKIFGVEFDENGKLVLKKKKA